MMKHLCMQFFFLSVKFVFGLHLEIQSIVVPMQERSNIYEKLKNNR